EGAAAPSLPEDVVPDTAPTRPSPEVPGGARVGDVGRHGGHGARGEGLISEHPTAGQVFRETLGDQYNEAHYGQDYTFVWEADAATAKTSSGATSDIARIRDVQARIARGEPINIVDEVVKSLDETLRARQAAGSEVAPEQVGQAGIAQLG